MNIYESALKKIKHDQKCKPASTIAYTIQTGGTGSTGPTGATGSAPTLVIGNVIIGAPGTNASATISQF